MLCIGREQWNFTKDFEKSRAGIRLSVWLHFATPRCLIFIIYSQGKSHLQSCFLKIFSLDKIIFYEKKTTCKTHESFTVCQTCSLIFGFVLPLLIF